MVSFSISIRSSGVYSSISGKGISFTFFLPPLPPSVREKKSICPSRFWRRLSATASMTDSYTWISWDRLAPRESKAPERIRFSTARLLMSLPAIRSQKS